jgi:hypothetical protein
MHWLHDTRTNCWSVLTHLSVEEYLRLVKDAHSSRGGIKGQRDILKTTTAKRIRDRLVEDIRKGAVLPPVVIGIVAEADRFSQMPSLTAKSIEEVFPEGIPGELAIIDGMQRTAALVEATEGHPEVNRRQVRVEFWIAESVDPLIYRMLVLNTGQVPWTLSRQLTVVYSPLLKEVCEKVPSLKRMLDLERAERRVEAGEFAPDDLVELYLAFSLRKTNVDTKEQLSEEFSRLDFVQNLASREFQEQFYKTLELLGEFDIAFSRFEGSGAGSLTKGKNVFDRQPARIGFVVAVALHVLGRPGSDRPAEERDSRMASVSTAAKGLIAELRAKSPEQVGDFLKLDVLSELLDRKSGQVGRYERQVFYDAFRVLIEDNFSVSSMESCWRAS